MYVKINIFESSVTGHRVCEVEKHLLPAGGFGGRRGAAAAVGAAGARLCVGSNVARKAKRTPLSGPQEKVETLRTAFQYGHYSP